MNTDAREVSNLINARGSFCAGIRGAFVNVDAAILASVPLGALARKVVYLVDAGSTILARMTQALVDIQVTSCTRKARLAVALIRSRPINANAILAHVRIKGALVNVLLAMGSIEAGWATAYKIGALHNLAGAMILTRRR